MCTTSLLQICPVRYPRRQDCVLQRSQAPYQGVDLVPTRHQQESIQVQVSLSSHMITIQNLQYFNRNTSAKQHFITRYGTPFLRLFKSHSITLSRHLLELQMILTYTGVENIYSRTGVHVRRHLHTRYRFTSSPLQQQSQGHKKRSNQKQTTMGKRRATRSRRGNLLSSQMNMIPQVNSYLPCLCQCRLTLHYIQV